MNQFGNYDIYTETFKEEMKLMLYGLGDDKNHSEETCELLDHVVQSQISQLMKLANGIAELQESNEITHENFLYLMLNNKTKLLRLLNCFFVKAQKNIHTKDLDGEEANVENESDRKLRICENFIKSMDCTGELQSVIEDVGKDVIGKRRAFIAYNSIKHLNDEDYSVYTKCRQFSFSKHSKRFQNWLSAAVNSLPRQPNKFSWELLAYFAQETTLEIIECSMIVQAEMLGKTPVTAGMDPGQLHMAGMNVSVDDIEKKALQPAHIRETLRRFSDCCKPGQLHAKNMVYNVTLDSCNETYRMPVICLL